MTFGREYIDAALTDKQALNAPCKRFSPRVSGSSDCNCGHDLYSHYMCGDPRDSYCQTCYSQTRRRKDWQEGTTPDESGAK
jgi:hypothetical protein